MESSAQFLLTIGAILLVGLLTSSIAKHTILPRVTLLLLLGVLVGDQVLDIIPPLFSEQFPLVADMTLLMVGFLLGGRLTRRSLQQHALIVFLISFVAAVVTTLVVSLSLMILNVAVELAIILGCIAAATAPAAIFDVVDESPKKGYFSRLLLAIVALDDIWALMLFALGIVMVSVLYQGNGLGWGMVLGSVFWEIGGAFLLGALIGFPAACLTGRVKKGKPIISEALGLVFLCGGMAIWLEVSHLIAAMVMGCVIANYARHHRYPFHAIENIESPLMVIFFVLAGASLELTALYSLGLISICYIVSRSVGKVLGAYLGSAMGDAPVLVKRWMGPALLPQAGVAIGMALVAANHLPEYRQELLSVVICSTIFFEIVGPVFTRYAILRSASLRG